MTREDKELLLKDLCARLPYGVKIELMPVTRGKYVTLTPVILQDYFISDDVNYLSYLRPMSSMTDEEREEFENLLEGIVDGIERWDKPDLCEEYDWLNKNYFDYRRLIEKGLALEAPEGMYD